MVIETCSKTSIKRRLVHYYIISITTGYGIKTSMGIRTDRRNGCHRYIGRKNAIEAKYHTFHLFQSLHHIKMSYHHSGMDSCISTSCSNNDNRMTQEQRQGFLQLLLNRYGIGLVLPTMVTSTVIGKKQEISRSRGKEGDISILSG